jgi:hypothetical protein
MTQGRLAALLAAVGAALIVSGLFTAAVREALIVVGVFFVLLAGGVLNWDRRGGH